MELTVKFRREWLLLLGSLLVVAALYNHYLGHSAYLVEIIFVAIGCALALYSIKGAQARATPVADGLLVKFFARYFPKKLVETALPLSGFVIILAWSGWKVIALGESDLHMEDFIVTLFGLALVLYHQGPASIAMQKDFVVLYLLFLTIVFAVIWKIYRVTTGTSFVEVTGYSEYYLITVPVSGLVRAFGVPVTTDLNLSGSGLSNVISYEFHGKILKLGIGSGCSGLYSAGLFFSAFLAFVLVRYTRVDKRIIVALGVGLAVTWASNIVRMVVTILVGHAWGHPALVVFHSYFGILLFVAVAIVFWIVIVKWLDRVEPKLSGPDGPAGVVPG